MKSKKDYNFIGRLIDKVTKNTCSNNTTLYYYGNKVYVQSGTRDYFSLYVIDKEEKDLFDLSFDYLTHELVIRDYQNIEIRDKIISSFKTLYNNHITITDELLDLVIKEQTEFVEILNENPSDYDEETIIEETDKLNKLIDERDKLNME